MLVYGKNVAEEILKKNEKVKKIIIEEGFNAKNIISLIENGKFNVEVRSKREMDRLADGLHQGIIIDVADYKYYDYSDIARNDMDFLLILDHIEDPHNLGAIIRTSEAAGVSGIILPRDRQVQVNSTVMKTSAGALSNMKLISVANLNSTIEKLKRDGFWVVGTAMDGDDYKTIDYSGKIALVIGNEGKGISRLVREKCDFVASIPMIGKINSLNASVASGIMIYEVVRHRK